MIGALLLAAAAGAVAAGAPWWVTAALVPGGLVLGPGLPLAARVLPDSTRLERLHAAAWLGLGVTWGVVALVREVGLRGPDAEAGVLVAAAVATALAWLAARGAPSPRPSPQWERVGAVLVVVAVLGVAGWRAQDVARPLDGYWYVEGAAEPPQEPLDLVPARGWSTPEPRGWPEAGALAVRPTSTTPTLATVNGARGRATLLVRGPVGSRIAVAGQEAVVAPAMQEDPSEGPVRRYLTRGTAGLVVDVDLPPGGELSLEVEGEQVYLLPGTDAVWALHESGDLRFTHYYQILNQVENLVWAQEVREDRWFTWNQPPGWSPILAATTLLAGDDLPAGNVLFLWVLGLVGLSSVRLAGTLAPSAPLGLVAAPAALVASHGLLMFEPASTNFPDSLYAAAILSTAAAAFDRRPRAFAWLGAATQALRWPGTVVSLLLLGAAWAADRVRVAPAALRLGGLIVAGAVVAGVAALTGQADDLLFILYFETFPEHWHDEYAPDALLPRAPTFYLRWLVYSGGAVALTMVALAVGGGPTRRRAAALLGATLAYSALLATVDHHPTHYFLPLVALSGPALVAASASLRGPWPWLLGALHLAGTGAFLSTGRVF